MPYDLKSSMIVQQSNPDVCHVLHNVSIFCQDHTVEPQLSELSGRHTTRSDNQGFRIDEMESC